ncbi:MAG: metallophosphoesterase family protein [bacterium]
MSKILAGVISDTHLNGIEEKLIRLYDNYLAHCDYIIHAGDLVADEVISFFKKPVFAVRGNMDFNSKLPVKRTVEILNKKIGIIHGYGAPEGIEDRIAKEFKDVNCIVYGHTHNPKSELINGVLFFNPGSPFDRRWSDRCSLGYLEIDEKGIKGIIKEVKED